MRRIVPPALLVLSCLCGALALGQTPSELFQRAKTQIQAGQFEAALATLGTLDSESAKPGMESERHKLEPSLYFLRGVCEASLDRNPEARADFQRLLAVSPRASIDPAAYSKKVVAAFGEAKKSAGTETAGSRSTPSLAEAYARFRPDLERPQGSSDTWAEGPVRYLLTAEERREWARASDAASRSEFITRFWVGRDPTPETPENEFRTEFEKRVAFADAALAQGEARGSLTDRGRVFVLMGPPTSVGRTGLAPGDDGSDVRPDSPSKLLDTYQNFRETWHYRRDRLPAGVPYQQVDFIFLTRIGYGSNVLQREADALRTLDAAVERKNSR